MIRLPLLLLALSALSGCSSKAIKGTQYILEARLTIDSRVLPKQHQTVSSDSHTALYFEDREKEKVYKLDAYLTKGKLAGTVNIFTQVSTIITSPSFLVFEGKSASATFPSVSPVVEVTVKAFQVGKTVIHQP